MKKYLAISNLEGTNLKSDGSGNAFEDYSFEAEASTAQAAINKVVKQATNEGLNALNSNGAITIYRLREFDKVYINTVSAWK